MIISYWRHTPMTEGDIIQLDLYLFACLFMKYDQRK